MHSVKGAGRSELSTETENGPFANMWPSPGAPEPVSHYKRQYTGENGAAQRGYRQGPCSTIDSAKVSFHI